MVYFDGVIYSWQKGGGVHRYFQKLISFTASKGIDTTLLLQEPRYDALPPADARLRFENLGMPRVAWPRQLFGIVRKLASPLNKFLVGRYFKNIDDGVFHSTYYTTYDSLRIPQVVTVHDMTYEKFPELYADAGSKRLIERKRLCIERADAIVCVSNATKTALLETHQIPEGKISVIHHGVDDFFNTEYDEETAERLMSRGALTKPFLLFVGNRAKYKNFEFLVRSFASWGERDDFQMAVAGGGGFTHAERALLAELGIASQVRHLGYVSEEELKALYCTCTAFVFPSLDEGFGLPILEAICCGARVVASDIAAFREIGLDIPLFFDPKNTGDLIEMLDKAISLRKSSADEVRKNANLIRERFNWDKSLGAMLRVYESLAR